MKEKYILIILFSVILAATSGCTKTESVYNVPNQNVKTNKSQHSAEDVKTAILRAGAALGWEMYSGKPGSVEATLHIRVHTAMVEISYGANRYNITYKDSDKLMYEAAGTEYTDEDGNTTTSQKSIIHKNYNVWIRDLDRAIKAQLLLL